uniref:Inner membrane protein n=1 Tax=Haemonchus contortus TaxID=6289 RepID=A0A7I4Y5I7_HAECO
MILATAVFFVVLILLTHMFGPIVLLHIGSAIASAAPLLLNLVWRIYTSIIGVVFGIVLCIYDIAAELKNSVRALLWRTTPKYTCVLSTAMNNVDTHATDRCHRCLDSISSTMRVSELHLCARSLHAKHEPAMGSVYM